MDIINENRIYRLCEYVIDLIDALPRYGTEFDWIKEEIEDLRKEIEEDK